MKAVGQHNAGKILVPFDDGLLGNANDLLYFRDLSKLNYFI